MPVQTDAAENTADKNVRSARDRKRRFVNALLAGTLVVVLVGGATTAYLSATETKNNTVFPVTDIGVKVVEEAWNPSLGKQLYPGKFIGKNPYIVNTNPDGADYEYVGMRITLQKAKHLNSDGSVRTWETMTQEDADNLFVGLALAQDSGINVTGRGFTPDSHWIRGDGAAHDKVAPVMMFYHRDALQPGSYGGWALVRKVGISSLAGFHPWSQGQTVTISNYMNWLYTAFPGGNFKIALDGAAVQTTGFADSAAANAELFKLLPIS